MSRHTKKIAAALSLIAGTVAVVLTQVACEPLTVGESQPSRAATSPLASASGRPAATTPLPSSKIASSTSSHNASQAPTATPRARSSIGTKASDKPGSAGNTSSTTARRVDDSAPPITPASSASSAARANAEAVAGVATSNPLAGIPLYVDKESKAMAASLGFSAGAQKVKIISLAPQAKWFGDWNPVNTVAATVSAYVGAAAQAHAEPMLVMYAIPHRDCGSYSAGGFANASQYGAWIQQVAAGIAGRRAAVILEPDSLGLMSCLSSTDQQIRLAILSNAVSVLAANANTAVYIDGGQSHWLTADVLAGRLKAAGVAKARGFSLNVSSFFSTPDELAYGEKVSALLGGKYYIVDTSRNGKGPEPGSDPLSWCNPPGRGLGVWPGTTTGAAHADAYLWIKRPGESDGNCRPGDPSSGAWYQSYAVGLVTTAGL